MSVSSDFLIRLLPEFIVIGGVLVGVIIHAWMLRKERK